MFFAALFVFLLSSWFLPWWHLGVLCLAMGILLQRRPWLSAQSALAAGLAWSILAFVQDGLNSGLVSKRVAGLFQLPMPILVYVITGLLGFITAFLFVSWGQSIRACVKK